MDMDYELPICSDTCNKWFEACKNDKTSSEDWLNEYAVYRFEKGPIKPTGPCRTFVEIFKNGEGLCNKMWGPGYKYDRSSNCIVHDFKSENPNDKVVPVPSFS
ncbi:riboflavin-binding protein-like [Actinia tenebrosa]|uniref:Riboflavin-binding protein-like n=1 Tax=Actinia tenebrosa TaxID=6105 RepID=A0A6P8IKD1_ACTTE|nr:riboflavin-binding protein-like [Actinia tenebrosa]